MSEEKYDLLADSVFMEFATTLTADISVDQFKRIDSNTISWTNQPRYNGQHMYIFIDLIKDDNKFDVYHFRLRLTNSRWSYYIDETSPLACIKELNSLIKACRTQENRRNDIWKQFGF